MKESTTSSYKTGNISSTATSSSPSNKSTTTATSTSGHTHGGHSIGPPAHDQTSSTPVVIPKNEFGGVLVTADQIHAAFQFLDVEKKNRVTFDNLKSRLSLFQDKLSSKEIKLLLNDQSELTEEYLNDLLLTNEVKNFDPIAEAFKVYDPEETGFISKERLRHVFENMGYDKLTEEDLNILIACADNDRDGKINLSDFRKMLQM